MTQHLTKETKVRSSLPGVMGFWDYGTLCTPNPCTHLLSTQERCFVLNGAISTRDNLCHRAMIEVWKCGMPIAQRVYSLFSMILWFIKVCGIRHMNQSLLLAQEMKLLEFGICELLKLWRPSKLTIMRFSAVTSINMRTILRLGQLITRSKYSIWGLRLIIHWWS